MSQDLELGRTPGLPAAVEPLRKDAERNGEAALGSGNQVGELAQTHCTPMEITQHFTQISSFC